MQQLQKPIQNKYKIQILQNITKIQCFNHFLNEKFKTSKRFGIQGVDSFVSGLIAICQQAALQNMKHIDFGMAHRGRLCTLALVFDKPLQQIFAQFQQLKSGQLQWGNSGDVKYHLGTVTKKNIKGNQITLAILPNPSHLQAVNPVVMGSNRATQDNLRDQNGQKAMNILIHGDAAVAGQGIVYQCLQMMNLQNFTTKGTLHIVANNQIGFTTTPLEARTGLYCTDVAKAIGAPIFHVNADDPIMVDRVCRLAFNYRQQFKKDVFVDVIGYRRYGHNQQDQPAFTQPIMYKQIQKHPKVYQIFRDQLINQNVITKDKAQQLWDKQQSRIQKSYIQSKKQTFDLKKFAGQSFHSLVNPSDKGRLKDTGLSIEKIKQLSDKIFNLPDNFHPHPQIKKIFQGRRNTIKNGQDIDFATAQALAFSSLLDQGYSLRLSGQDVQRGTFSHRHAKLVDQISNQKYNIYQGLNKKDVICSISNSLLSQYGCLGYQYGYTLSNPNALVIWQAQFGDFANQAQVIFDNFIVSAQTKWNIQSGIVINLPHGMDGQGPQHSSGRIQRFLSSFQQTLSKVDLEKPVRRQILNSNIQVIVPSVSGNYFHALRRQMRRLYRKPLFSFNSKRLLRYKPACCNFQMLKQGNRFFTCFPQTKTNINTPDKVRKVIACSGQVYYDLIQKRNQLNITDVAIVRVQQLAPFPYQHFKEIIAPYKNSQFVWVQQQHKNSGGWQFVEPRINMILQHLQKKQVFSKLHNLQYVGRKVSASTAVGSKKIHDIQLNQILKDAFK